MCVLLISLSAPDLSWVWVEEECQLLCQWILPSIMLDCFSSLAGSCVHRAMASLQIDLITPFFSLSLCLCASASFFPAAVVWVLIKSCLLGICFGFSDKSSCLIPPSHNGKVCGLCLFNQKNILKIPPSGWLVQVEAWLLPFGICCATSNSIHNFGFLCMCL